MIKKLAAAAAALAVAVISPPSIAQNSQMLGPDYQALRQASIDIYNTCLFSTANYNDTGCACVAGYLGGLLSPREFEVAGWLGRIGELVSSGASQAEINAAVQAFMAEGFTMQDAETVQAKMEAGVAEGDVICDPYDKTKASS